MSFTLPWSAREQKAVYILAGKMPLSLLSALCKHDLLKIPCHLAVKHVRHVCSLPGFLICSITEANKYTQEELRFMKSQDASYISLRAQTEMKVHFPVVYVAFTYVSHSTCLPYLLGQIKPLTCVQKVERLRSQLHFIGAAAPNQHVVFVEDEAAAQSFSAEQHFDTPSELLDRGFNRPRTAQLQEPMQAADALTRNRQRHADR